MVKLIEYSTYPSLHLVLCSYSVDTYYLILPNKNIIFCLNSNKNSVLDLDPDLFFNALPEPDSNVQHTDRNQDLGTLKTNKKVYT